MEIHGLQFDEELERYRFFDEEGRQHTIVFPFSREFSELLPTPVPELSIELARISSCYLKGLSLLARREHSRVQLEIKLTQRKFIRSHIRKALDALEDEGALSDLRFANEWIDNRLQRHPEGPGRISIELQKRGIHTKLAKQAINDYISDNPQGFYRACLRLLLKLNRNNITIEELREKASKRGFDKNILADCAGEFYTSTGRLL